MDIRKGSILIVIDDFTFNPIENIIEKTTGDGHHTANYVGDGYITESHFGKGVTQRGIEKYYDGKSRVLILEPRLSKFSEAVVGVVIKRWLGDVGKPYDNAGVLAKRWRLFRRWVKDDRRICSEHTAYGYKGFYNFLGKNYADVTPNDILRDQLYNNFKHFKPSWLRTP